MDASIRCAAGTELDEASGTCVVAASACAEGTSLVDGVCIADDDAPDPDAAVIEVECGEGTTLVDGECVLERGADLLRLETGRSYAEPLLAFFRRRERMLWR